MGTIQLAELQDHDVIRLGGRPTTAAKVFHAHDVGTVSFFGATTHQNMPVDAEYEFPADMSVELLNRPESSAGAEDRLATLQGDADRRADRHRVAALAKMDAFICRLSGLREALMGETVPYVTSGGDLRLVDDALAIQREVDGWAVATEHAAELQLPTD